MLLTDINILVYAHNPPSENHEKYRSWLEQVLNGDESFGLSDLVVSSFVRIATSPRIFNSPSTLDQAFTFAEQLRSNENCVAVNPGPRHWGIFQNLGKQRTHEEVSLLTPT